MVCITRLIDTYNNFIRNLLEFDFQYNPFDAYYTYYKVLAFNEWKIFAQKKFMKRYRIITPSSKKYATCMMIAMAMMYL